MSNELINDLDLHESKSIEGELFWYAGSMLSGKTKALIDDWDSLCRYPEIDSSRILVLQSVKNIRAEDQNQITSRNINPDTGEATMIHRPARMVESLVEIPDEDLVDVIAVMLDEVWMHGQDSSREIAQENAVREVEQIYRWLGKGIDVYATTLNLFANTNEPPMNTLLRRRAPTPTSKLADCFGNGDGCAHKATHTAIYQQDNTRVPLRELPDYVPQESMTDDSSQVVKYKALCQRHFMADLTHDDKNFMMRNGDLWVSNDD